MNFELKDICFFDCETTGVPAKGLKWDADFNQFPHVVQLAWAFGDKERSFIIKPDNYEIPPETTYNPVFRRLRPVRGRYTPVNWREFGEIRGLWG